LEEVNAALSGTCKTNYQMLLVKGHQSDGVLVTVSDFLKLNLNKIIYIK